jgi:hypothetical protein
MVLARPSMRTSWPASGSIADRRHVCTMALSVIREMTSRRSLHVPKSLG